MGYFCVLSACVVSVYIGRCTQQHKGTEMEMNIGKICDSNV
jgi:hypothetical protein